MYNPVVEQLSIRVNSKAAALHMRLDNLCRLLSEHVAEMDDDEKATADLREADRALNVASGAVKSVEDALVAADVVDVEEGLDDDLEGDGDGPDGEDVGDEPEE